MLIFKIITFANIPRSLHEATNASRKLSPEWGPDSFTKSINVSWSCQSIFIQ